MPNQNQTELKYLTNRHYLFVSLLLTLFLCSQLSILHFYIEWIRDALFNFVLIYIAWNVSHFIYSLELIPKKHIQPNNRAVLITGCDSGFGYHLAVNLYKKGYYIFATCLSLNSDGAKKLNGPNFNEKIFTIELDVTDDESVKNASKVVETILRKYQNISLWAIVNNAGIMSLNEIEFGDMTLFHRQMEVNGMGVVRVSKQFLPFLRHNRFNQGRIINMASIAGRFSMPGFGAYCMSKAVVLSFTDALRREMSKWNIEVIAIIPHLYKTNLVNQNRLNEEFKIHWDQTEELTKEDYGQEYYDGFIRTMTMALETARDDIQEVVNTMTNSVTLADVDNYYVVARKSERIRLWFWETIAPIALIDYLMKKTLTNGVPKQISNQTIYLKTLKKAK